MKHTKIKFVYDLECSVTKQLSRCSVYDYSTTSHHTIRPYTRQSSAVTSDGWKHWYFGKYIHVLPWIFSFDTQFQISIFNVQCWYHYLPGKFAIRINCIDNIVKYLFHYLLYSAFNVIVVIYVLTTIFLS